MKNPLKNFTIAITGDFGKERSLEKMRKWIHVNGGTHSSDVNPSVTHLVCSKENFKRGVTMVKIACELESVKIVSFDWLEDCLLRMRPLSYRRYLMSQRTRTHKEVKKAKSANREKNVQKGMEAFEQGCKEFGREMHSSLTPKRQLLASLTPYVGNYHIYIDPTNYCYDITLARADLLANKNERHMLKLYESHAIPRLYACFEKHSKPGEPSAASQLAPIGSSFHVAFDHFKKFFKLKTGKDWDDRLEKTRPSPGAFLFIPPVEGESRGVTLNDEGSEANGVSKSGSMVSDSSIPTNSIFGGPNSGGIHGSGVKVDHDEYASAGELVEVERWNRMS